VQRPITKKVNGENAMHSQHSPSDSTPSAGRATAAPAGERPEQPRIIALGDLDIVQGGLYGTYPDWSSPWYEQY
jgi:hypothetical protein